MTAKQELRVLGWIVKWVGKLTPTGRRWLMQRLVAVECGDVPVSAYLQVGWRSVAETVVPRRRHRSMEIEDVHAWVTKVEGAITDPEAAHSLEDQLWLRVLKAIAEGAPNGRELAAAAVITVELDFPRWCA